jgi:3-hydroxyisobutyrate dehydrogenase
MGYKLRKIGIVGLGIMGRGMAANFLKKGHEVYVWNRTAAVADEFKKLGATVCATPRAVAQAAEIVFEVTAADNSSREVWLGDDGIAGGADPEKVLIASSTLSAAWTDELISVCIDKHLRFLDIPLTGGRIGAETGALTLLCGGDQALVEELKPTFTAIAKNVFYFGPAGHGMRYKLILNFLQATHVIAFGQAMAMARESGMDLEKVAEALAFRPGGVVTEIAKNTYFKDPDPITFSVEWITKDLTYAKELAENVDASVLDAVLKKYQEAIAKGYADKDWASVNTLD